MASLFWWLWGLLLPAMRRGWEGLKKQIQSARQGMLASSDRKRGNHHAGVYASQIARQNPEAGTLQETVKFLTQKPNWRVK